MIERMREEGRKGWRKMEDDDDGITKGEKEMDDY